LASKILDAINLKKCAVLGAASALGLNFIKNYQESLLISAFARSELPIKGQYKFFKTDYSNLEDIAKELNEIDYIFYCIGVTNASDDQIKAINIDLFDKIFAQIKSPKKVIFISSAAVLFNQGAYVDSKLHCEKFLAASEHQYFALRPSVMHGSFDKNNIIKMIEFIQKVPFIPVIAPNYVIQPVYMLDILKTVKEAIDKDIFTNKNYTVSGPAQLKLYEVFRLLKKKLNSKKVLIPIPLKPVQWVVKFLSLFLPKDKIMAHQILNMKLHSPFDSSELSKDYGYKPTTFEKSLFEY